MRRPVVALAVGAGLLVAAEAWLGGHGVPGGFLVGGAVGAVLLVVGAKALGAVLRRPDDGPPAGPPPETS